MASGFKTFKTQVDLGPGQSLAFKPGRGYYAKSALKPTVEKPAQPSSLDPRVAPYLQPQLDIIDKQDAANQHALTSFTQAVLQQLQGVAPQVASDYDTAINQSRSLAQAGADSLRNANGNQAIQSILQAAGAPEGQQQQVAAHLGNVFNGGSAALFGSQGVFPGQQLIRDKASNVAFANQLPGINALAGTAALKNLLFNTGLDREKVLAQAPSILSDIAQNQAAAASAKAEADYKKQYLGYLGDTLGVKAATAKTSADQGAARIAIAQQNADTAAQRAADAAAAARARIDIQRKAAGKKAGPKPPTGGQLATLVDQWYGGKTGNVRKPVLDENGVQKTNPTSGAPMFATVTQRSGQLSYQQAYKRLLALKVPKPEAASLLDTKYQRGERGRPWLGIQQRTVLAKAGVKPAHALYYKKQAFLNGRQVQALKSAQLLPPGELVKGRYFIQPGY